MQDSKSRSFAKGISWRILASLTTFILALFLIKEDKQDQLFAISVTEFVSKLVFYYLYERLWNFIPYGRTSKGPSHIRSVVKGIGWRIIATSTVMLIVYVFTKDISDAAALAAIDFLVKLVVYYFHERVWATVRWGRIKGNVNPTLSNKNLIEELDIEKVNVIAKKAGEKILEIYTKDDFEKTIDFKADDSPLTIADKASHNIIVEELEKLNLGIPILSEEGEEISYKRRKEWTYFWCVDPLDGTKEFIKKNGEFTVNIALIYKDKPLLGVIYAPVLNVNYYGKIGVGAYREEGGEVKEIKSNYRADNRVAVKSKSHASEHEDKVCLDHQIKETISVGSSLKFCMVAEGRADIYYRHGPTMEWDTAAGQAIVEASGGKVLDAKNKIFKYNKEVLKNGSFMCVGDS